jgi:pyridoxal/pyridoxine/pyridoxamine kinase
MLEKLIIALCLIGTAIAAVNILKDWGLKRIIFCSILGSKSGVEALQAEHPDIEIIVGFMDEMLTEDGYIYPGVGDVSSALGSSNYLTRLETDCLKHLINKYMYVFFTLLQSYQRPTRFLNHGNFIERSLCNGNYKFIFTIYN